MRERFVLSAFVQSDVGRIRNNNEDNYCVCDIYRKDTRINNSNASADTFDDRTVFSVCDGMGGEERGEVASLIAVKHIHPYSIPLVKERAVTDYLLANEEICKERRLINGARIGSTFASLFIDHGKAIAANIGDSRIYLFRKKELLQLSEDHDEATRLVKIGVLTPEEALHDKRKHSLTQHLGLFEEEFTPEAFWSEIIDIQDGDRFLLCSDGITDMLSDDHISAILKNASDSKSAARQLVDAALEAGGKDNTTALVVDIRRERKKKNGFAFSLVIFLIGLLIGLTPVLLRHIRRSQSTQSGTTNASIESTEEESSTDSNSIGNMVVITPGADSSDILATDDLDETTKTMASTVFIENIVPISNLPELPSGSAVASLAMALRHAGYENADKMVLSEYHLAKAPVSYQYSPYHYFIGEPSDDGGYGCFAQVIVDCAASFGAVSQNISNCNPDDILHYIDFGQPVLAWVTTNLTDVSQGSYSFYDDNGNLSFWKNNSHCVLITGYSVENQTITVADPLNGDFIDYDFDLFWTRWDEMGRQAVLIDKNENPSES